MADLRDPGGIQRNLFCRTVWIAESDVGRKLRSLFLRGLKRILPMGRRWREGDDKKALNGAFLWETRNKKTPVRVFNNWLRGPDLNRRPSGYEPDELPGCSTPRHRTAFTSSNLIGCGGRI